MLYKVVCIAYGRPTRAVPNMGGLYLEEVQKICKDPETSSRTAKGKAAKARTRRLGCDWFFGYEEDK